MRLNCGTYEFLEELGGANLYFKPEEENTLYLWKNKSKNECSLNFETAQNKVREMRLRQCLNSTV